MLEDNRSKADREYVPENLENTGLEVLDSTLRDYFKYYCGGLDDRLTPDELVLVEDLKRGIGHFYGLAEEPPTSKDIFIQEENSVVTSRGKVIVIFDVHSPRGAKVLPAGKVIDRPYSEFSGGTPEVLLEEIDGPVLVLLESSVDGNIIFRPVFSKAAYELALQHKRDVRMQLEGAYDGERVHAVDPVSAASILYTLLLGSIKSQIEARNQKGDALWSLVGVLRFDTRDEKRHEVDAAVAAFEPSSNGLFQPHVGLERHAVDLEWNPLFGVVLPRWVGFETRKPYGTLSS